MKERVFTGAALAIAMCAAAIAYGPALDGEFHFDDFTSITENWTIREPVRLLRETRAVELLGPGRPVTQVTFALAYALGGLGPRAYHLTSLALHLIATALVYFLALGALRGRARWVAVMTAAGFALHPLHIEAVAYAAQLSEVLAGALGLGALLALVAAGRRWPGRRAWAFVALATGLHVLAIGAKVVAVATPAAFTLHGLVFPMREGERNRSRLLRAASLSAPLWLLSVASVIRSLVFLGERDTAGLHAGVLGPWRYLLTEVRVHWLYARLLALPVGQNIEHHLDPSAGLLHFPTVVALSGTCALLAGAVVLWERAERGRAGWEARAVVFGLGFFLIELAPSSSIVPIADPVAEHRVYVASAGLLLAFAAGAQSVLHRNFAATSRKIGGVVAVAALAALGAALHARATVWRSEMALWVDAVEKNPESARAWSNLAHARYERGETEEAVAAYGRAEALAKRHSQVGVIAAVAAGLSALYGERGAPNLALAAIERGLAVAPRDPLLHSNRAAALRLLGQLDEARLAAQLSIELEPHPKSHDLLGLILAEQDDDGGALEAFRKARLLDPGAPSYAEHEFIALYRLGRTGDACLAWTRIVNAGWLSTTGVRPRAIAESLRCR